MVNRVEVADGDYLVVSITNDFSPDAAMTAGRLNRTCYVQKDQIFGKQSGACYTLFVIYYQPRSGGRREALTTTCSQDFLARADRHKDCPIVLNQSDTIRLNKLSDMPPGSKATYKGKRAISLTLEEALDA